MHRIGDSEAKIYQNIGRYEPITYCWTVGMVVRSQVPEGTLQKKRLAEIEGAEAYAGQNNRRESPPVMPESEFEQRVWFVLVFIYQLICQYQPTRTLHENLHFSHLSAKDSKFFSPII
jgi:hypothetical protein